MEKERMMNIQGEKMWKLTVAEGGDMSRMMREEKGKLAEVSVCLGGPESGWTQVFPLLFPCFTTSFFFFPSSLPPLVAFAI